MSKKRIVHYINQFYAGIGGEEQAHIEPFKKDEVMGPGLALSKALEAEAEFVGTVVCGDSYFNENSNAIEIVLDYIKSFEPDLVIAGPAFNAGRYGVACGAVAEAVTKELGIPAITGMYEENPGVDMYRKSAIIVKTGNSAAAMRQAVPAIANVVKKVIADEQILPEVDGYFVRHRKNYFAEKRGATRAVEMLIKKLNDEPFETEYPMPDFDNVDPAQPVADIKKAKIAIVTSGGTVPKGNPDRIESSSASKYGKYSIADFSDLTAADHETAHGGYDPMYANEDSDRVIPVDVLREKEKNGEIGALHEYFYTTVGNGTAVANAKRFAAEIAQDLLANDVTAVILTST